MICKCGGNAKRQTLKRGDHPYWFCESCGREEGGLPNKAFKWDQVGWYQDVLRPLPFLLTKERTYNLCLLRKPTTYVARMPGAEKYLHGLIELDGNIR